MAVPDIRFKWLADEYKPSSQVPAYLSVIDIAGLVKGASQGQGLGNAFLSHIRAVDGIFHMIRAFTSDEIVHVEGDVDPIRDMEIIREELRAKDEELLEKAVDAARKALRGHEQDKVKKFELETLQKLYDCLVTQKNQDIRHTEWSSKEIDEVINPLQLLTAKPIVYLVNISEQEFITKKNKWLGKIKAWIDENSQGDPLIPFSAEFEKKDPPADQSSLPKMITAGYNTLQLINYFTAGEDEVKAWTIRRGTKAPQAAGVIHSDFERGFIMAEIMHYQDLNELKSEVAVRAAGKYLQKGKEYVVEDGDVIYFKHNASSIKKK